MDQTERAYMLTDNEYAFIEAVLGDLPTKTGAFLVLNKLAGQRKAHEQASAPPDQKPE